MYVCVAGMDNADLPFTVTWLCLLASLADHVSHEVGHFDLLRVRVAWHLLVDAQVLVAYVFNRMKN